MRNIPIGEDHKRYPYRFFPGGDKFKTKAAAVRHAKKYAARGHSNSQQARVLNYRDMNRIKTVWTVADMPKQNNPRVGKVIRGAHVRLMANGRLNVVLPRSLQRRTNPSDRIFNGKGAAKVYAQSVRDGGNTARIVKVPGGYLVVPGGKKRKKR